MVISGAWGLANINSQKFEGLQEFQGQHGLSLLPELSELSQVAGLSAQSEVSELSELSELPELSKLSGRRELGELPMLCTRALLNVMLRPHLALDTTHWTGKF